MVPDEEDERDEEISRLSGPTFDEEVIMQKFESIVMRSRTPSPDKKSHFSRKSLSMPFDEFRRVSMLMKLLLTHPQIGRSPRDTIRKGSITEVNARLIDLEDTLLKLKEKNITDNLRIAELEEKLDRRNRTINDLRRDFAIELLQLRLSGASETNKADAASRAIERMKRDDDKISLLEQEKEQLVGELAKKEQEILALGKEALRESNKFKKTKMDMQTNIYELEDKIRATNAELKQKNSLLASRNAIVEQLNFTIAQRDENYLKLEARITSIMDDCASQESVNNTLRLELDQVSELLVNSQRMAKATRDDMTMLKYEKEKAETSLAKWKNEYASLTERYKALAEQYDELASIKREERREEKARRKSVRRASKMGQMVPEGALQAFPEEGEGDEEQDGPATGSPVELEKLASDDKSDESDDPINDHTLSGGQKHSNRDGLTSTKKRKASTRRRSSAKPSTPADKKSSIVSKSPRKVSLSQSDGGKNSASHRVEETDDHGTSATSSSSASRRLTRMRSTSSTTGDIIPASPRATYATNDKHVQTDIQGIEQATALEKHSLLQRDLQDKKETISSMENHIFLLNTQLCELRLKTEEQRKAIVEREATARKWKAMLDEKRGDVSDAEMKGSFGHGVLSRVKMKTERYEELEAAKAQLEAATREVEALQESLDLAVMEIKRNQVEIGRLVAHNKKMSKRSRRTRNSTSEEESGDANGEDDTGTVATVITDWKGVLQRRQGNVEALHLFVTRNNKSTQCGSVQTSEIEVQTIAQPQINASTQTRQLGPLVPPQYCSEESFLGYMFREISCVCRHFVDQALLIKRPVWPSFESPFAMSELLDPSNGLTNEMSRHISRFISRERDLLAYIDFQKRVNSQCRKFITSLVSLRSDLISEMRERGGEWMSPNSRTVVWTLEAVLKALDKCLNSSSEKEIENVPPSDIHSAPPGGRQDNMTLMSDDSGSVISYELDYVQAGTALHMPRMMKTLLKSPVTCRISKEPPLPDYEFVGAGEWDGLLDQYDEDEPTGVVLFGRVSEEHDVTRRAWDRETLNAGVNRGVLLSHHPQEKTANMTDRILLVRPGGIVDSHTGKSLLKHNFTSPSSTRTKQASPHMVVSGISESKHAVVSFSPHPDSMNKIKETGHSDRDTENIATEIWSTLVQNADDADTEDDYMIYHRRIEPNLPASRKSGSSPRKTPQQRQVLSSSERPLFHGGRVSPNTKRVEAEKPPKDNVGNDAHGYMSSSDAMLEVSAAGNKAREHLGELRPANIGHVDLDSDDESSPI